MKLDVKSRLVERLSPLLQEKGFVFKEETPGKFINTESEDFFIEMFLGVSQKSPRQSVSSFAICFYEVENKLMELGRIPGLNFIEFREQNIFHTTIRHHFAGELSLLKYKVNDEDDLESFISNIELYVNDYGLPFVSEFSSLGRLLNFMDELTSQGKHWNEIIDGGPEFLFRGLIISKICEDEKFDSKLALVEQLVINELSDQDWVDAFNKLKAILKI